MTRQSSAKGSSQNDYHRLGAQVKESLDTPCLVVVSARLHNNIKRVQKLCDDAGLANRPHIKTHKSVHVAQLQLANGACGVTCAKLSEAEVMADGGVDDILIMYNLLGTDKMERLSRLLGKVRISVVADSPFVVDGLKNGVKRSDAPLPVLIECANGRRRTGLSKIADVIDLARRITSAPNLTFGGLALYPHESSWPETQRFVDDIETALNQEGISIPTISTGGTPNLAHMSELRQNTEHRPGTYVYNDRSEVAVGSASRGDCAASVIATVVSVTDNEYCVIDAGSKVLTADLGETELDGSYGEIVEYPGARVIALSEEHGVIEAINGGSLPKIGEIVQIIPNHICVAVNMFRSFWLYDEMDGIENIKIEAQNCVR